MEFIASVHLYLVLVQGNHVPGQHGGVLPPDSHRDLLHRLLHLVTMFPLRHFGSNLTHSMNGKPNHHISQGSLKYNPPYLFNYESHNLKEKFPKVY